MLKVAALEAERRHLLEMQLRAAGFFDREAVEEYVAFDITPAGE
jgi:hypothetical protein